MIQLLHGDCLELMKDIPDKSIDMIKDDGAIVLFGSEPFSTELRHSNLKMFRYDWIWEKEQGANFMNCKFQPFKVHEIVSVFSKKRHRYYPQMTKGKPYECKRGTEAEVFCGIKGHKSKHITKNDGKRYPKTVLKFNKETGLHPTQKPVPLLEYLIKTYTNEGDTVLDNCMGSGSTGVACVNLNRNFIGIELEEEYFDIANERINHARLNQPTGGD